VRELLWDAVLAFNYVVLFYFVALNTVYLGTSFLAFGALRRHAMRMKSLDLTDLITSHAAPPITLVAPAFNEAHTCVESVRSLLTLEYPGYEIVFVNDGSTDDTLARMTEAFELEPAARIPTAALPTAEVRQVLRSRRYPELWVIDKANGGKADALNAGINLCQSPLFCAMDADSLIEPQALIRIVRPFLEDSSTVGVGGILRIANGCRVERGRVVDVRLPRNMLARFQVLEYLRAFLSGRMGWDAVDATLVISGAFGIFKRSIVVEAGGYATDTVGEDMELIVRLRRHCAETGQSCRIHFVPDPVAWTECPETIRVLARQRDRWQRGLLQSLVRHRVMLFNPRYGAAGVVAFPYFFFLEMLGPVIELLGYVSFTALIVAGRADLLFVAAFLCASVVLGMSLSISAVALEELSFRRYPRFLDLLRLFGIGLLENFGYRQLNAFWRLRGTISALRGVQGWGIMTRKGFLMSDRETAA